MHAVMSLGLGYFLGCISPAKLVSRRKNVDLKQEGTTNLGATNTALVLGLGYGALVMVIDMLKSYFSVKLARFFFPNLAGAGMLAGIGCLVGHCFPVFLKFKGGKGLASYGGMVFAHSPRIFLTIVIPGVILMTLLNTGVTMPVFASVMFPVLIYSRTGDLVDTLLAVAAGIFLVGMHWENLKKAISGQDYITTRRFFKDFLFRKR